MSLPGSTSAPSSAWPHVGRLEEEAIQGHHSVSATDGELLPRWLAGHAPGKNPFGKEKAKASLLLSISLSDRGTLINAGISPAVKWIFRRTTTRSACHWKSYSCFPKSSLKMTVYIPCQSGHSLGMMISFSKWVFLTQGTCNYFLPLCLSLLQG